MRKIKLTALLATLTIGGSAGVTWAQTSTSETPTFGQVQTQDQQVDPTNPVTRRINPLDLSVAQIQVNQNEIPTDPTTDPGTTVDPTTQTEPIPQVDQIGPRKTGRTPRQAPLPFDDFGNAVPEREYLNTRTPSNMEIGPSDQGRPPRQTPIPFGNLGNATPEREYLNRGVPSNMEIGPSDQGRPPRETPIPFGDLGNVTPELSSQGLNQGLTGTGTPGNFTSSLGTAGFPVYPDPYAYSNYGNYGNQNQYGYPGQGVADILRSSGQAVEGYSRAAINYQEAYSRYLDNSLKYVDIYWKRKQLAQMNFEERYQDIRERREDYLKYQRKMAATRPTLAQLDPNTGNIAWPTALLEPEYVAYRARLEELFDLRTTATSSVPGLANEIEETAAAMQEILKRNINDVPTNAYLVARRFLDGVKNEVRVVSLNSNP